MVLQYTNLSHPYYSKWGMDSTPTIEYFEGDEQPSI
jgi:hypothetical protein